MLPYCYFSIGNFRRNTKLWPIFEFFAFTSTSIVHRPFGSLEVVGLPVTDCRSQVII